MVITYVTVPSKALAQNIAKICISERLAACASILGPSESHYIWDGTMQKAKEYVLLLKTTSACKNKLTKRIASLHTYECPCILQFSTNQGNSKYLRWIRETVNC